MVTYYIRTASLCQRSCVPNRFRYPHPAPRTPMTLPIRQRNAATTREAILGAARQRFMLDGFDHAGLRFASFEFLDFDAY